MNHTGNQNNTFPRLDSLKRQSPSLALLTVLFGVILLTIFWPLGNLVVESLQVEGKFSLSALAALFDPQNPVSLEALMGSVNISLLTVLFSLLTGLPLAVFFSRFDFPGRKLFGILVTLPLILPPMVGVIAFFFLMGETGIVPRLLQKFLGLSSPPLVMNGVPAILLVHTYSFYVFFYLFGRNALADLDRSLEEAAYGLGASRWMIWRSVILPQLKPAILGASLLVFMNSMASFTAPYLFGGEWRFLSLEIYNAKLNGDFPLAISLSVLLAAISTVFLILVRVFGGAQGLGRGSKGVSSPPRVLTANWQKVILMAIGFIIILILAMPQMTLLAIAFVKNGTWTWQILPDTFTFENFTQLFTTARVAEPWLNSLWMAAIATGAGVLVATMAAVFASSRQTSAPVKSLIDVSIMLPWAVPGTVIAIALIVSFDSPHWFTGRQVLVGTSLILPFAYFIRHLPIQFRATLAVFSGFDSSLDEAAQNLGAGVWMRLRRITLPLILPGIVTGGMVAFVIALGEFVSSILLYTHSNRPLSIAIFSELRLFNLGSAAAYAVMLTALIGIVIGVTQKLSGNRNLNI